jgi:hypothetical protein
MKRPTFWGSMVAAGCAYEIVALFTQRVPTITQVMYIIRRHYLLRLLFWLITGMSLHHFYVEEGMFPGPPRRISSPTA